MTPPLPRGHRDWPKQPLSDGYPELTLTLHYVYLNATARFRPDRDERLCPPDLARWRLESTGMGRGLADPDPRRLRRLELRCVEPIIKMRWAESPPEGAPENVN